MEQNLPCIVIVTFNRPQSLSRLLRSLAEADFSTYNNVPLVISIDGGGSPECLKIARDFRWSIGPKEIIEQPANLGLKAHVLFCGDLTEKYDSVILLEDDLFLSPCFYRYATSALTFYREDSRIAGISLYNYQINELNNIPFLPFHDGFDNYFVQFAASWGQVWAKGQWRGFRKWLEGKEDYDLFPISIPSKVKNWSSSSWKKFFIGYLAEQAKYFVYPRISYSTNLSEVGTHLKRKTGLYQTSLAIRNKFSFRLSSLNESNSRYDSFFEIESTVIRGFPEIEKSENFEMDLYGLKTADDFKSTMIYTSRPKSTTACLKGFSNELEPLELNIVYGLRGDKIYLTRKENIDFDDSDGSVSLFLNTFRIGTIKRLVQISILFFAARFTKK